MIHSVLDTMYAKAPYTVIQRAMHIHPDCLGVSADHARNSQAVAMIEGAARSHDLEGFTCALSRWAAGRFRYSHNSDIPAVPEIVPSRPVSSLGDFGYRGRLAASRPTSRPGGDAKE